MTRGRKPNIIASSLINLALPSDVRGRLDLHLYSELEARIPVGAYQRFFVERIREFFSQEELDLAPYLNVPVGAMIVKGPRQSLKALKERLGNGSISGS